MHNFGFPSYHREYAPYSLHVSSFFIWTIEQMYRFAFYLHLYGNIWQIQQHMLNIIQSKVQMY